MITETIETSGTTIKEGLSSAGNSVKEGLVGSLKGINEIQSGIVDLARAILYTAIWYGMNIFLKGASA
ncbi:MAG: hypothetical protein HW415_258 [Deltaproteobacteria bacterium]|nr:hypothetical protein [Deltaproteobacteria bacterium]